MKNKLALVVVIVILVVVGTFVYQYKNDPIVGCYVMRTNKDAYTLNILSQDGRVVAGRMVFKNFERDSSQGDFKGEYRKGILVGDYSFQSEGTASRVQMAFKRQGENFIRGYGETNPTGERFSDLNNITYDASNFLSLFRKEGEPCATSL